MLKDRISAIFYAKIAAIVALIAFGACGKTKSATTAGTCQTQGIIVDYDGLDGCGYLIQLKDGKLLNPTAFPEGFQLRNGQAVRFDYLVLKDMASVCMAESQIVQLSCIEDAKNPTTTDCSKINNPFAVDWMNKAIDRHNPVRIIKYQMNGSWTFAFEAEPSKTFLYDCDGNLICQSNGDQSDDCHRQHLKFFTKGKTIWQGEGVWD